MSATYDLNRMLGNYIDAADELAEPPTLLPAVFAATRGMQQRRGLVGRVQTTLSNASPSWTARPVLTYALLILLLLAMTFALAFSAGLLRPPIPTGWRVLDEDQFTFVNQVSSFPGGFIAIGSSPELQSDCPTDTDRSRVWTSPDGDSWTDHSTELFRTVRPQQVSSSNGWIYLGVSDIVCYDENGEGAELGGGLLRSRDGVTWETLPHSDELFQWGNVPLVVDTGSRLVAIGSYQQPLPNGEFDAGTPTVWSSANGANWQRLTAFPGMSYILDLAAVGETVVAIGAFADQPRVVLLTSTDSGTTWQSQELPDGVPSSVTFLEAAHGRFVAAGDDAGLVSTDGLTWTPAIFDNGSLNGVTGLTAVPGGYLAIREDREDKAHEDVCREVSGPPVAVPVPSGEPIPEWTPNPNPVMTCSPVALGGGTSYSRDGVNWTSGPDLPRSPNTPASGGSYTVAVGERGLVAVDLSRAGEVWYSPLEPFLTGD